MPRHQIIGPPSAIALAIALLAGCGSAQPAAPAGELVPFTAVQATPTPHATPTPLATEKQSSTAPTANPTAEPTPRPTAKATPKPKPKPTPKPPSFYKPPGWDGSSDVNCTDFDTHAHAQSFFKGTGGSTSNDPYGLDRDHDGIACESLP